MQLLLKQLYQETNTNNVDDLLLYYQNLEEQNLRYYQKTKQLIEEIDKTKDKKLQMQMELRAMVTSKANQQSLKETIMREMAEEYENSVQKMESVQKEKEELRKIVNTLKISIQVIINRLSFEKEGLSEKESKIIQNIEVPNYLFKLEKKTNQILKLIRENNLESKIFDENQNKSMKLDDNKQLKQFLNNINEIKKIHYGNEEEVNTILGPSDLKKNAQKEIEKILKRGEAKKQ